MLQTWKRKNYHKKINETKLIFIFLSMASSTTSSTAAVEEVTSGNSKTQKDDHALILLKALARYCAAEMFTKTIAIR